jgi:hypothetical protein
MERVVTDKTGRRLTLRKFGLLETLRLYKALGPELSTNAAYMGVAQVVSSVAMLDDIPIPFPNGESAIENLIERLGDEAIKAVASAITPAMPELVVADAGN